MFPWKQLYLSNCQNFLKYGQSFSDYANFRQKLISANFSANPIAHILMIIKKYVSKKYHAFNESDKPKTQEVNFDVFSNVLTFLTSHVKVETVYKFKRLYFNEYWR